MDQLENIEFQTNKKGTPRTQLLRFDIPLNSTWVRFPEICLWENCEAGSKTEMSIRGGGVGEKPDGSLLFVTLEE